MRMSYTQGKTQREGVFCQLFNSFDIDTYMTLMLIYMQFSPNQG